MRTKQLNEGFETLSIEKARIIARLIGDGAVFKTNHDYVLFHKKIGFGLDRKQERLAEFVRFC